MQEYETPIVTVDIVPLVIHDKKLKVLLSMRDKEPYAGHQALIGGFIHTQEDRDGGEAARRVLRQKAGITQLYVEQLSTFSGLDRDPRGWSVSISYFSLCPYEYIEAALVQSHLEFVEVSKAMGLPFDHDTIVKAALSRLRGKGAYSDLIARLLPTDFTLPELHEAYEIVLDEKIDINAFRQKIRERDFLIKSEGKRRSEDATKPAQLYHLKSGYNVFDRRL